MRVRDVMRCGVRSIPASASITDAAKAMADSGAGALPVVEDRRLVGIVTDCDLAVRGVAAGLAPETCVSEVMTTDVAVCGAGDQIADVLHDMVRQRVRQIPVCSPSGEPIGMLSLDDAAQCEEYAGEVAETLGGICRGRQRHRQPREAAPA